MGDIVIRIVELPITVDAAVSEDENGDYSIYLNSRHTFERNQIKLRHELEHIKRNHFDRSVSAEVAEREAKDAEREAV